MKEKKNKNRRIKKVLIATAMFCGLLIPISVTSVYARPVTPIEDGEGGSKPSNSSSSNSSSSTSSNSSSSTNYSRASEEHKELFTEGTGWRKVTAEYWQINQAKNPGNFWWGGYTGDNYDQSLIFTYLSEDATNRAVNSAYIVEYTYSYRDDNGNLQTKTIFEDARTLEYRDKEKQMLNSKFSDTGNFINLKNVNGWNSQLQGVSIPGMNKLTFQQLLPDRSEMKTRDIEWYGGLTDWRDLTDEEYNDIMHASIDNAFLDHAYGMEWFGNRLYSDGIFYAYHYYKGQFPDENGKIQNGTKYPVNISTLKEFMNNGQVITEVTNKDDIEKVNYVLYFPKYKVETLYYCNFWYLETTDSNGDKHLEDPSVDPHAANPVETLPNENESNEPDTSSVPGTTQTPNFELPKTEVIAGSVVKDDPTTDEDETGAHPVYAIDGDFKGIVNVKGELLTKVEETSDGTIVNKDTGKLLPGYEDQKKGEVEYDTKNENPSYSKNTKKEASSSDFWSNLWDSLFGSDNIW